MIKRTVDDIRNRMFRLDKLDLAILKILTDNARMPYSDMAVMLGVKEDRVQRHTEKMQRFGIIEKFTVDINWDKVVEE